MRKKLTQVLFMCVMFALLISSCIGEPVVQAHPTECIKSFQEFAYLGSQLDSNTRVEMILPPSPWNIERIIPTEKVDGYFISYIDAEIARSINGHQEIWLIEHLYPIGSSQSNKKNLFLVYQPDSKKWETVSSAVGDINLFVQNLFVTSDGNIWGQVVWDTIRMSPNLENAPVLAKYNEDTKRFEFAKGVLEIPWKQDDSATFPWPEIVLDNHDVFWFFTRNDGLYRYDPSSQATEKRADLLNSNVTQTALSTDGSIYFEIYSEKIYSEESFFRLSDGMLLQFFPKTNEIVPLDIPDGRWPIFTGMLVDLGDRLWLGAIGYQEPNGEWKLIHPDPQEYFEHAGDIYWAPPALMLESSNGILWYRKFLDDTRANGTAWYDPQTGEGCMFTNMAVNIIEDSEQQLWLVADGKLYKNPLNP